MSFAQNVRSFGTSLVNGLRSGAASGAAGLASMAFPAATGLAMQLKNRYTGSLAGTPTNMAKTVDQPVQTVTRPTAPAVSSAPAAPTPTTTPQSTSYSTQPYSMPSSSATTTPNPALAQLKAESAATQGGNNAVARQLSGAYTGRGTVPGVNAGTSMTTELRNPMNQPGRQTTELRSSVDAGTRFNATGSTPQTGTIMDQLRNRVSSLSTPSTEEQRLNDELALLRESARMAESNVEGQGRGIVTSLVRGEQAKLNEQSAIKEQTLLDRITAMATQRQAELQSAQNEYTMATQNQARQDQLMQYEQQRQDQLTAPTSVGGNILQYDPSTGTYKTLYSAPQTAAEGPTSVQEYQFATQSGYTGSYTDFLREKAAATQNHANLQYIQPNANSTGGTFDPNTGVFTPNPSAPKQVSQLSQDALGLVNTLMNHPGREAATGTNRLLAMVPGSAGADFKAQLERLKALLSLDNIQYLKGTGAMSDREFATLSSAAAALQPNMSEGAFLQELQRIQSDLSASTQSGSGTQSTPYDSLLQNGLISQQEYQELLQEAGFTNDLSTSQNGSLGSLSEKYESGGNPGAIGYDSTGGYSYGTYQLAHNNAQSFVNQSRYANEFKGLAFNSPQYRQKWQEIAQRDPLGFGAAQKDYIKKTHFDPQIQKLSSAGINVNGLNPVVLDAIWSTAVQHGPSTSIALNALKTAGADPASQLRAIYNARWNNGQNFRSSTPQVQNAVKNRLLGQNGELALALSRLSSKNQLA